MRILLIPEVSVSGGTGTFLKQLLNVHQKLNIDTEIILPESLYNTSLVTHIKSLDFNLHLIPNRRSYEYISYFSLFYEFKNYRNFIRKFNPDLIVCSTGTLGLNFFTFLFNYPLVFILHSYPKKIRWWEKPVFLIPQLLSRKSKIVYTVSEFSKKMILKYWGLTEKNVKVIYNSISTVEYDRARPNKRIILTLGHVVEYKNIFVWIEIAKRINEKFDDTEFIWLGDGEMLAECIHLTSAHSRINFLGYDANPGKYYASAYLYLHPSKIESFGLSVIDALAYGVPCIISNAGGLPETLEDGISGFICDVNDVVSYFSKIKLLLENQKLHGKMAKASSLHAKNCFSAEAQLKQIHDLYTNTIANYN